MECSTDSCAPDYPELETGTNAQRYVSHLGVFGERSLPLGVGPTMHRDAQILSHSPISHNCMFAVRGARAERGLPEIPEFQHSPR